MSEHQSPRGIRGQASQPPVFNVPAVVVAVIAALVAIHVGLWLGGEDWEIWATRAFAIIPARFTDPGFSMIRGSEYWSLATYMLLHADWMHLTFNCIWLLIFGTPVVRYMGIARFLMICLFSGVFGGLCSLIWHWGEVIAIAGASAGVMGLMGASLPLMYGKRGSDGRWRPARFDELLTNRDALIFSAIILAITLFSGGTGWTGISFLPESSIAWEAHIGGFIGGLFAFYVLAPRMRAA